MSESFGDRRRIAVSVPDLVAAARLERPAAVARLISLVEDDSPVLREVMLALAPHTGGAHVIGITGAPGVGKSTTTNALVSHYRARGARVAVLAVDPSSPFSGGALLGDRIRMSDHAADVGVFIRSMASRGHLGGLARATPQAIRVLDASGFDVVLVETVGVGQSEVEIAGTADTTLVLLAPGMGDGIQAAKAGLLEIGDLYVVNKADRDGADVVRRDLRTMLHLAEPPAGAWERPVLKASAQDGQGIDDVVVQLDAHRAWALESGELARRRAVRVASEIEAIALAELQAAWRAGAAAETPSGNSLTSLAAAVSAGTMDPYAAAARLVESARAPHA